MYVYFIRVSSNLLVERTCIGNKNRLLRASTRGGEGERKTDTWLPLHRTGSENNESRARACGLIFHLDVARAAVASGRFVGGQLKLRRRLYYGSREFALLHNLISIARIRGAGDYRVPMSLSRDNSSLNGNIKMDTYIFMQALSLP